MRGHVSSVLILTLAACGDVVTPPKDADVTISPSAPRTADDLVATSNVEGVTLRWSKNGQVRDDITGLQVDNSLTAKGETWGVDMVWTNGDVIAHEEVVIANTAPIALDARVEGTSVLSTTLQCLLIGTPTDADDDLVTVAVTWQKNATPLTTATMTMLAGDTVPAAERAEGDDFLCTITAADGTDVTMAMAGAEWFLPNGTTDMGTKQMFTVPADVSSVFIEAGGAEGGSTDIPGATYGARLGGTFVLPAGTAIELLVGQAPSGALAGGGGTFVVGPGNMPLVIAGGGGSKNPGTITPAESMGRIVTSGGTAGTTTRADNGSGGSIVTDSNSGAGAGFMTDGSGAGGGKAFVNGGAGAGTDYQGGFGGGGGRTGLWGQGGGGGYSGGSCGDTYDAALNTGTWVGCGGGGSLNTGTSPIDTAGAVKGPGYVFIVW